MSNYTVKNLKEVDNAAEQFGIEGNLEARFARKPLELANFGFSYQKLTPNFRMPFGHTHGEQEEVVCRPAAAAGASRSRTRSSS